MKIVIIGSGTGGLFSAITIRKRDREAEIVILDNKDFDLLHPCGLPYVLEKRVENNEVKDEFPDMNFRKMHNMMVTGIVPGKKEVHAVDVKSNKEHVEKYDRLIISSGASAFVPPIPGADKKGVFKLDTFEDGVKINEAMADIDQAVVVGAGAIGLETAFALRKRGLDVLLIEALSSLLPKAVDPDIAGILQGYLEKQGIRIMLNSRLDEIQGKDTVEGIMVGGERIDCQMVLMAVGVRGNINFLEGSEIATGKFGILTNERMQTNIPEIYAIGDCVQVKSMIDGRDMLMQLAVAAYKQGIVAGYNILGMERTYKGALATFASKIGEIEVASTGFPMHLLEHPVIGKATGHTKPSWCQGSTELTVKILADGNGRILGAQAIGENGPAERINIVSIAIKAGLTVYDLSETELAYCPAVSETYDVLMQAADSIIRKLEIK